MFIKDNKQYVFIIQLFYTFRKLVYMTIFKNENLLQTQNVNQLQRSRSFQLVGLLLINDHIYVFLFESNWNRLKINNLTGEKGIQID